eukprot:TRINITY_DN71801_c0_g1_i1.p1 TRINITY_DN71801_c0_g1~~TRINITY_DN71801_c0_g1_i1.p1  ORF type:complete len:225 (+),score=37.31 TRINITY_DN71801_c0_g1_i1:54-728(+)
MMKRGILHVGALTLCVALDGACSEDACASSSDEDVAALLQKKIAKAAKDLFCPPGYTQQGPLGADIAGCGLEPGCPGGVGVPTPTACAEKCAKKNCKTFTFAPVGGDANYPQDTLCLLYYSKWNGKRMWGEKQILCQADPPPDCSKLYSDNTPCPDLQSWAGKNTCVASTGTGIIRSTCTQFCKKYGMECIKGSDNKFFTECTRDDNKDEACDAPKWKQICACA